MKLIATKKGLKIQSNYGDESIHINHTHESLNDFKEDIWSPYMVAEECSNYPIIHLVVAIDEQHALEQVREYIQENEGIPEEEETHEAQLYGLINVQRLELGVCYAIIDKTSTSDKYICGAEDEMVEHWCEAQLYGAVEEVKQQIELANWGDWAEVIEVTPEMI